jgi:hypothetical protein
MNESNCTSGIGTVPKCGGKHWNVNNNAFLYWGGTKHGVPQGSIQNFLYFFISISDCPKTIHGKYKQLLLANDTD